MLYTIIVWALTVVPSTHAPNFPILFGQQENCERAARAYKETGETAYCTRVEIPIRDEDEVR